MKIRELKTSDEFNWHNLPHARYKCVGHCEGGIIGYDIANDNYFVTERLDDEVHLQQDMLKIIAKLLKDAGISSNTVASSVSLLIEMYEERGNEMSRLTKQSNGLVLELQKTSKRVKICKEELATAQNERDGLQKSYCTNELMKQLDSYRTKFNEHIKLLNDAGYDSETTSANILELIEDKCRFQKACQIYQETIKVMKQRLDKAEDDTDSVIDQQEGLQDIKAGQYFMVDNQPMSIYLCSGVEDKLILCNHGHQGYAKYRCRKATWDQVFPVGKKVTADFGMLGTSDAEITANTFKSPDTGKIKIYVRYSNGTECAVDVTKLTWRKELTRRLE